MKKKFNDWIFEKAKGWQIFLVFASIGTAFTFAMFIGFDFLVQKPTINVWTALVMSFIVGGLLSGWLPTHMIIESRKASKFHEAFKPFEEALDAATTSEETKRVYEEAWDWWENKNDTGTRLQFKMRTFITEYKSKMKTLIKLGL